MKAIGLTLSAIATAFSIGIANADAPPRATEVIIVTAPKPRPIEIDPIASPPRVEHRIDHASLAIEPPRLDPSAVAIEGSVKTERPVELALSEAAKSKS